MYSFVIHSFICKYINYSRISKIFSVKFRIIIRSRFGATKFRLFSFRHRIHPAYERRASTAFRRRTGVECRGRISLPRYLLVIGTNLGLGVILLIYSKYWSRYEVGLGNRLRRACRKRACRNILRRRKRYVRRRTSGRKEAGTAGYKS